MDERGRAHRSGATPAHGVNGVTETSHGTGPDHICMFLTDLSGGGAERTMLDLAAGFARRGHRVDLVLAAATGPYLDTVHERVHLVDLRAGRTARAILPLAAYLRRDRPDVVFTTLHHACLAASAAHALTRSPSRLFLREATTVSARPLTAHNLRQRFQRLAMRWAYGRADGAIAVSEGVANDLRRVFGVPEHKIWTLYNPVVTDDIARLAAEPPEHGWFDGVGPPVVLGVGRLVEPKGFMTLLNAFAMVRTRRPVRLMLLGEGPHRQDLERHARTLGVADDVALPGFVSNPFAYLARSAVYVLSSRFEGLPGTLIQALACGCPVVATDCLSGPAEILDRGSFGELVPVGDSAAIAAAIERTLDSPMPAELLRRRASVYAAEPVVSAHLRAFASGGPRGRVAPAASGRTVKEVS